MNVIRNEIEEIVLNGFIDYLNGSENALFETVKKIGEFEKDYPTAVSSFREKRRQFCLCMNVEKKKFEDICNALKKVVPNWEKTLVYTITTNHKTVEGEPCYDFYADLSEEEINDVTREASKIWEAKRK